MDPNAKFFNPRTGGLFILDLLTAGLALFVGVVGQSFWAGVFTCFFLIVYFTPTIVARGRSAPDLGSVIVINLLLGWTLIGWIVALVMALKAQKVVVRP